MVNLCCICQSLSWIRLGCGNTGYSRRQQEYITDIEFNRVKFVKKPVEKRRYLRMAENHDKLSTVQMISIGFKFDLKSRGSGTSSVESRRSERGLSKSEDFVRRGRTKQRICGRLGRSYCGAASFHAGIFSPKSSLSWPVR